MPKLTIFVEDQEGPRHAPNALGTRLYVSETDRSEDKRAIELFNKLADVLGQAGFTDREQVLTLVRVAGTDAQLLKQLPRLVNGAVYTGVSEIEGYVQSCQKGYEVYERLHA